MLAKRSMRSQAGLLRMQREYHSVGLTLDSIQIEKARCVLSSRELAACTHTFLLLLTVGVT